MVVVALALAGAVALWLPAFRFRIDAATCGSWPALGAGAGYALAYVVAVALLSLAWLRALKTDWTLARVIAVGVLVHAVAMVAPPFASNDPLMYAAIGRAMAKFHASPATPLSLSLPAGDRFLAILPPSWQGGTSAYGPVFNQLARAIALVTGDHLGAALRLYQLVNFCLLTGSCFVAGRTFGPRAAALVMLAPVAVVDGTVNPHNDALIALLTALFALALVRGRTRAAVVPLVVALAVKLSAALLLAFDLLRRALAPIAARVRASALVTAGAIVAALGVAAIVVAPHLWPSLGAFTAIIGDPAESSPHFSRSVEGLPRALLTFIVHRPAASWAIGLVFRAAGGLWILWCAYRAARDRAPLAWAALLLFVYFLFLHAFVQSWYLLPLLPLATQLPAYATRAFYIFIICITLYYGISIPLDCDARPVVLGAKELAEAALVILPAAFTLLFDWRGARARASGGTSPRAA